MGAELVGPPPSAVRRRQRLHAEHDELAMGEVDDVHHAPIRVSPAENSAYTAPSRRPPTTTCTRSTQHPAKPFPGWSLSTPHFQPLLGTQPIVGRALGQTAVVAVLELGQIGRGQHVLAVLVELHAVVARDQLLVRLRSVASAPRGSSRIGRTGAVERLAKREEALQARAPRRRRARRRRSSSCRVGASHQRGARLPGLP